MVAFYIGYVPNILRILDQRIPRELSNSRSFEMLLPGYFVGTRTASSLNA